METDHLEHTGICGRIILKWILQTWVEGQEQWQALVDVVMNLWVSQNVGNFLTSFIPVNFSRCTVLWS